MSASPPVYIDTSSLLKFFLPEPETHAVQQALAAESQVIVSELTLLEALSQLRGRVQGGKLSEKAHDLTSLRLIQIDLSAPFELRTVSHSLFKTALRQHEADATVHCRTLDRLHLAAMESFGIRRLMTHDNRQSSAAKALSYAVITPT